MVLMKKLIYKILKYNNYKNKEQGMCRIDFKYSTSIIMLYEKQQDYK